MKAKLCFNEEIHRVSNLPPTYTALTQLVSTLFHSPLPESWFLQYKDSEGDNVLIHDQNDYDEFKSSELKASGTIVKIYVIPTNVFKPSQILSEGESIILPPENKKDEFQVVEEEEIKPNQAIEIKEEVIKAPLVEEPKESKNTEDTPNKDSKEAETPQETPDETPGETPEGNEDTPGSPEIQENPQLSKALEALNELLDEKQEEVEQKVEEKRVEEPEEEKREEIVKEDVHEPKIELKKDEKDSKVYVDVSDLQKLISSMIDKSLPGIVQRTHQQLEEQRSLNQSMNQSMLGDNSVLLSDRLNSSSVSRAIHSGVRCNGCQAMPIVGFRYKCTTCSDFNYCESCEDSSEHPHNFIKMKKPQAAPQVLKPALVDLSTLKVSEWMKFNPNNGSLLDELARVRNEEKIQEVKPVQEKKPAQDKKPKTKYDIVVEKAEKLQKCFPKEEFDNLCIFVSDAPEDMSLEELVENFKVGLKERQE